MATQHMLRLAMLAVCGGVVSGQAHAASTERVSVRSNGGQANNVSSEASISGDGRFVAFESSATNLVADDTNVVADVFVRDRQSGTTERVSIDSGGAEGDGFSFNAAISADGRFVAFVSLATNLVAGDSNGAYDVFVRDRQAGTTERVSLDSNEAEGNDLSFEPAISADGLLVAFSSFASNLVPGDTNDFQDVFVHDRQSGTTEMVSVDGGGAEGNSGSAGPSISADGLFVAFHSFASNLATGDANGTYDIFVRNRQSGTTERVSLDSDEAEGNGVSFDSAISADGRFVAFQSNATNLVTGDANGVGDIFVRDRPAGTTERVSLDSNEVEGNSTGNSSGPSISADGRFVTFESNASNLVADDINGAGDIFVRDRQSGTTERVSVDSGGGEGDELSFRSAISSDGRFVAFQSEAANLVAGDTNGFQDIFVRDRVPECRGRDATIWEPPLVGTGGRDVIVGTGGADEIDGRGSDDWICAGGGNDAIAGGGGEDRMYGEGGNDTFVGGLGDDLHHGGEGRDTIVFGGSARITVNLGVRAPQNTGQGADRFVSVENAVGSRAGDSLTGSGAANRLEGGRGSDVLRGGRGDDVLIGGRDADNLDGGRARDKLGGGAGGGDQCNGGSGGDRFAGGSQQASGCESAVSIP